MKTSQTDDVHKPVDGKQKCDIVCGRIDGR